MLINLNNPKNQYSPLINYPKTESLIGMLSFFTTRPYAYAFSHLAALKDTQNQDILTKVKHVVLLFLEAIPLINIPFAIAEHKINSYLENRCHYLNAEHFLETFNRNFKHLSTNVKSESISEILSLARVVFLSDKHTVQRYHELHGFLINSLWQDGNRILTENVSQVCHVKKEYLQFESAWDLKDGRLSNRNDCELLLCSFAPQIKDLLENDLSIEKYNQLCVDLNQLYWSLNLETDCSLQKLSEGPYLEDTKKLVLFWLEIYKENLLQRIKATLDPNAFYKRNEHLINRLMEELVQGASRVFLIAGRDHFDTGSISCSYQFTEEDKKMEVAAVNLIFDTLQQKNISYMHLRPRRKTLTNSFELNKWRPMPTKKHSQKVPSDLLAGYWKEFNTPITNSIEECYQSFLEKEASLWRENEKGEIFTTNIWINQVGDLAWRYIRRILQELEQISMESETSEASAIAT